MNTSQISQAFLNQYYGALQTNRAALINFYNDHSQMTYTGTHYRGLKQIEEKIQSFSFQTIQFSNLSNDVQDGPIQGSFIVFVCGYLQMDGTDQFRFSQIFNILPNGQGGLYIHNDIFTVII